MKDIKAILEKITLSDKDRQMIIDAVNENYRTKIEVDKKADRIAELEEQNGALTEQVGKLEGDGEELKKLRDQVQQYADAEEKRKADQAEQEKRESFRAMFDAAIGDRAFANDIIRESVFDKTFAKCSSQTGLDAKTVIEELTKDADGVWKNPQNEVSRMPDPAAISTQKTTGEDAAKREISNFLFRKKE